MVIDGLFLVLLVQVWHMVQFQSQCFWNHLPEDKNGCQSSLGLQSIIKGISVHCKCKDVNIVCVDTSVSFVLIKIAWLLPIRSRCLLGGKGTFPSSSFSWEECCHFIYLFILEVISVSCASLSCVLLAFVSAGTCVSMKSCVNQIQILVPFLKVSVLRCLKSCSRLFGDIVATWQFSEDL